MTAATGNGGRWHGRVAVGVIVGGAAAVVVGLVAAYGRDRGPVPTPTGLLAVAVVVILLAWGLRAVLASAGFRPPTDPHSERLTWGLWTFVPSAITAASGWWHVPREVEGGVPTRPLPQVAGGATLVAFGCLLIAVTAQRAGRPPTRSDVTESSTRARPSLAAVALSAMAALLAAGSVAVAASAVERAPVSATTTAAPDEPPFSGRPEGALWRWAPPGADRVFLENIRGTTTGVAVALSDRVVALDRATGEEAWTYRRSGAVVTTLSASLSGRSLAAVFVPTGSDDSYRRLVTFDASTGRVGIDRVVDDIERPLLTDDALIHREDRTLEALSLDDGHRMWEWDLPDDCEFVGFSGKIIATASVVVAGGLCGELGRSATATLVAIDGATGDELWRFVGGDDNITADLQVTEDGAYALLSWGGESTPTGNALIDVATGEEALPDVPLGGSFYGTGYGMVSPPPIAGTIYAAGVLTVDEATSAYTVTGYDGTVRAVVASSCPEDVNRNAVATVDALVEMCPPTGAARATVIVTPLDRPADAFQFTDPGLADPSDSLTIVPSGVLVMNRFEFTGFVALG